ncbi:hypothetical protein FQN54_001074 [Arachnomyces sp. PD_36]|nr:hypothetical protein FQN54_001074 [Arachnomyces sp. PD_36]
MSTARHVDPVGSFPQEQILGIGRATFILSRHGKPSQSLQVSWFREMARTLAYIHSRRVIVADIASRNVLLDSNLSIQICDFTKSIIMPLDTCMEIAEEGGYSVQMDIGQLGAVIYEVVVGEKCTFDIFKDVPPDLSHRIWQLWEVLESVEAKSEQGFEGTCSPYTLPSCSGWCSDSGLSISGLKHLANQPRRELFTKRDEAVFTVGFAGLANCTTQARLVASETSFPKRNDISSHQNSYPTHKPLRVKGKLDDSNPHSIKGVAKSSERQLLTKHGYLRRF